MKKSKVYFGRQFNNSGGKRLVLTISGYFGKTISIRYMRGSIDSLVCQTTFRGGQEQI